MKIPYSEDLGNGLYLMDVAPKDGCMACGDWKWGYAMVDTNLRVDLLTDKPLDYWTARSDCVRCGVSSKWRMNPDRPFPESHDDPFAK